MAAAVDAAAEADARRAERNRENFIHDDAQEVHEEDVVDDPEHSDAVK